MSDRIAEAELKRLREIEKRAKGAARPWNPVSGECPEYIKQGILLAQYILDGKVSR